MAAAKGKEPSERASAGGPRRCSNLFLKLLLFICIVALVIFFVFSYPLLVADSVHVILPGQSVESWPHAISSDYVDKNSEDKLARLNETFLAYAAIDGSQDVDKRRAKMLLEGDRMEAQVRQNRWPFHKGMDHYDIGRPRARTRPKYDTWQLQLQSPRYSSFWPRFRRLLQAWIQKKRHEPQVMGELLSTMKKPMDDFYKSNVRQSSEEGKPYKTCAVVGNSGILINKSLGSFIDSHDAVIRLNNARVATFENSVGIKTTVSFVNSNVYHSCSRRLKCYCHPYGQVPIVMYLCQVQHLMDIAYCEANFDAPVLVTDPRFDMLCARVIKWYSVKHYVEVTANPIRKWDSDHNAAEFHYSSGLQAVMLALGICEKVDLLGFGKSPDAKHHYHTNQKGELTLHDYEAEYLFYDDLMSNRTANIPFLSEASFELPPVQIYR